MPLTLPGILEMRFIRPPRKSSHHPHHSFIPYLLSLFHQTPPPSTARNTHGSVVTWLGGGGGGGTPCKFVTQSSPFRNGIAKSMAKRQQDTYSETQQHGAVRTWLWHSFTWSGDPPPPPRWIAVSQGQGLLLLCDEDTPGPLLLSLCAICKAWSQFHI